MELLQMGVAITGDDVCHQVDDGSYDNSNGPYAVGAIDKEEKKKAVRSKKDSFRTHNGDRCYLLMWFKIYCKHS